jgi:hypothetical protein
MSLNKKFLCGGCVAVVVHDNVLPSLKYPEGTVTSTVKVLSVSVDTGVNDAGLVPDIVPISVVGTVMIPSEATAKPLSVISAHDKVGLNGCVAVVVQLSVAPALKYSAGTVMSTFRVLTVLTSTIANEAGLVLDIVPISVLGSVMVPF